MAGKGELNKEETNTDGNEDSTEEVSEETESTTDNSSSKEVQDEETTDDSEDITKKYFTDPDSLDPKLRGAFKKMQGVFTKKMQEASLGIKKASAFDQLVLDPEFRAWMEERNNKATGKTSSRKEVKEVDDDENDEDDDTPMTRKALRAELQGIFKTMAQEGNQKQQEEEQAKATMKEAADFKKANPDWELYKDPIMSLIERHPTLSYQDAYDLAVREDNKKSNTKETVETKKRANINKPNKVTGKTTEKKGKMSVKEAFDQAKKSLGL